MNFKGNQDSATIYFEQNKIFFNGELFDLNSVINTEKYSRFGFGDSSAKILNGILSVTDGNSIKTLNKVETLKKVKEWKKWIVTKGLYVYLNSSETKIKLNDSEFEVTDKGSSGISRIFKCEAGILSISSNVLLRPSTWNALEINLKE